MSPRRVVEEHFPRPLRSPGLPHLQSDVILPVQRRAFNKSNARSRRVLHELEANYEAKFAEYRRSKFNPLNERSSALTFSISLRTTSKNHK